MLNKKNIAMAMAAATVAMPMTQSFAAVVGSEQTAEIKAMKEKALELMNKEFTENETLLKDPAVAGLKVFKVLLNGKEYTRYSDFERAFDDAYAELEEGQSLKVSYDYAQGVGYTVLADGSIVDFDTDTFTQDDLDAEAGVVAGAEGNNATNGDSGVSVGGVQYKVDEDDNSRTYQVRLTDGKNDIKRFADVKVGDVKLDFSKPMLRQENGYYVDIDGDSIREVDDEEIVALANGVVTIAGTEYSNVVVDGFYVDSTDAAKTPVIVSDVIKKGVQKTELNVSELFNINEGKVTAKGNELLNKLQELTYDLKDIDYTVTTTEISAGQEMKIVIEKKDKDDQYSKLVKVEEIRVVRDAADKKAEAYNEMKELLLSKDFSTNNAEAANYQDKIAVAAGADRYATAAELSRKGFASLAGDKAIVLVTGEQDKLVDGLTATPLAAALNGGAGAPVLLTGNDKLAQPVIDEIERLDAQEVYIVGGAISESVERDLERVYGMEVTRVSGDDRYDTSLEVADEMHDITGNFDELFVVGGRSEADALSAGAAAAMNEAPILLTNEDKLNKDVKYYLEGSKVNDDSKIYVVGGNISKAAYNTMLDIDEKGSVERLSGDNRQDTNAAVIEEFFTVAGTNSVKATKVVVAKSDNKGMVDALGAGLYAGLNDAPVVLATNSLTEDQEDALDKMTITNDANINRLQVGEGIASAVVNFIKDLI